MTIARTHTGAFIGTSESSLQSIAAGTTQTGAEVDVLGDDTSVGELAAYLVVTATAASSVDVRINPRRATGQAYQQAVFPINVSTINGTIKVPLGRYSASRYMSADLRNNDGTNAISAFVGYELEKIS